jgi:hypothetical protein
MKKGILFILLISFSQIFPQQQSWIDGDPAFTNTYAFDPGLKINEVITLAPQAGISGENELLNYKLFGLDWTWPGLKTPISSAEDIDYRQVGDKGLYLVTDASANVVMEFNPETEQVVWSFGSKNVGDRDYLKSPVDAALFKEGDLFKVLIADEARHRVLKIDKESRAVEWFYGDPNGQEGNQREQLNSPNDAVLVPGSSTYLIADKGNNRVIIVDEESKDIIWQLSSDTLQSPVDVEYATSTDEILITDQGNQRIILVNRSTKAITWQFGTKGVAGSDEFSLASPTDADILNNGNILICDAGNNRIIEVNRDGQIVWRFHRPLQALQDADRMPDNRHLVITNFFPNILGYSDSLKVMQFYDLGEGRQVIFDSLQWQTETNAFTEISFQFRSANDYSNLTSAEWLGPNGSNTFYTVNGQEINSSHRGHRFYQVRAFMQTSNPLYTPTLNKVIVYYHYYNTDAKARFRSPVISNESGAFVNKWEEMVIHTRIPADPEDRDKVRLDFFIRNAETNEELASFSASQISEETTEYLDNYANLQGVKSIVLVGSASTLKSYTTPVLEDWEITWQRILASTSSLSFVNRSGNQPSHYRATDVLPPQQNKVDSVRLAFSDPDLEAFQNRIELLVYTKKSKDSVTVELNVNPIGGFFVNKPVPILVSPQTDSENDILEVLDRDTLYVRYQDADDPADVSADTILVVKNTVPEFYIEDRAGNDISGEKVGFSDSLYFRIVGENDQNLLPFEQESIFIQVFDNATGDLEDVQLFELLDSTGVYNSGEFSSQTPLLLEQNNNGIQNDGVLQSMYNHRVTARYVDNLTQTQSVFMPVQTFPPVTPADSSLFGAQPYIVQVAPNPYKQYEGINFKLRIASATGQITPKLITIYNLAGERIIEIDPRTLTFDQSFPVAPLTFAQTDYWWDLRTESGHEASSGTYFLKIESDLFYEDTDISEGVAIIKKFVLIR